MPSSAGPNTFGEENLVFGYDLGDVSNSYKGEPTINRAYLHNARIDNSYTALDLSGYQGALESLHLEPLTVYDQNGGNISTYFNTGINISNSGVDWYNTNHAYWVYDEILKKPVTQIIDRNGVWQAKYMGLGITWDDMGMAPGDQYTISWLQWNSDGVKRPNVGVYWNSGGGNNFWDGTRDVGASPAGVWTRKSYTWTLGNYDTNTSLTLYMYGHYYSRATFRIADVQIEKKDHASQFSFGYERSATQGLIDLKGTSTIDLTNVSFDSDAQMTFDGTDDYIEIGGYFNYDNATLSMWIRPDSLSNITIPISKNTLSSPHLYGYIQYYDNQLRFYAPGNNLTVNWGTISTNTWYNIVLTVNGSLHVAYKNGVQISSQASNLPLFTGDYNVQLGRYGTGNPYRYQGLINSLRIYNRALTAQEVASNYNAIKGRFNI